MCKAYLGTGSEVSCCVGKLGVRGKFAIYIGPERLAPCANGDRH